jgi:hypothetical protein
MSKKNKRPISNRQGMDIKTNIKNEAVEEKNIDDKKSSLFDVKEEPEITDYPEPPELEKRITTCLVNVREKQTKDSDVLTILEKDTVVRGIDCGEWFNIIEVDRSSTLGISMKEYWNGYTMSEFLK